MAHTSANSAATTDRGAAFDERRLLIACALATAASMLLPRDSFSASLGELTSKDADMGVKAALERGVAMAVSQLGKPDGFWANERIRIPLPDWIPRFERAIKVLGRSKDIETIKLGVNRAAEQAVPLARALLVAAIRAMNVQDAKAILSGGDGAVTRYFQEKSQAALTQKFLPVVTGVTSRIGLAQQYNSLAQQLQQTGLVKLPPDQQRVETHVTRKALEGLFLIIAEEEGKIRRDPVGTGSEILKRVFGGLR
ncbi:MAG: DUF4197 domain-containing protein [Betaproteobacteria bacterium]